MSKIFINPSEVELNEETVISINRVSKATTGGRRMRFNSLVVVGDGNGHVGIGFGKANDVAMAVSKAKEKAKKRIIKVPIIKEKIQCQMYDQNRTCIDYHKLNEGLEKQVIGRAYRLGRTGPLKVHKLIPNPCP